MHIARFTLPIFSGIRQQQVHIPQHTTQNLITQHYIAHIIHHTTLPAWPVPMITARCWSRSPTIAVCNAVDNSNRRSIIFCARAISPYKKVQKTVSLLGTSDKARQYKLMQQVLVQVRSWYKYKDNNGYITSLERAWRVFIAS